MKKIKIAVKKGDKLKKVVRDRFKYYYRQGK